MCPSLACATTTTTTELQATVGRPTSRTWPQATLTYLRFASSGLEAYEEAAWILLQTDVNAPNQWPDMNYAIWAIFNPTVRIDSTAQAWIDQAQSQAKKKFPNVDFSLVMIATPVDINAPPTSDQEFMYITPEPGSLILLVSGALGMARLLRRKAIT